MVRYQVPFTVTVDIAFVGFAPRSGACVVRLRTTPLLDAYSLVSTVIATGTIARFLHNPYAIYMTLSARQFSALLLTLLLLLTPLVFLANKYTPLTWTNRLASPDFTNESNLHTPRNVIGTYLPPDIDQDTILTPDNNPVIITNNTLIHQSATLTIQPGTNLYFSEFAHLSVNGNLQIKGATQNPITLTSNEINPANQTWNGIIINPGGHANLNHSNFSFAAPAISCLPDSQLEAKQINIKDSLAGVYSQTSTCQVNDSRIQAQTDGFIAIGYHPTTDSLNIVASRNNVKIIEQ